MGRTLKRVDMAFDWPIGKVWHGYLNPHYKADACLFCGGMGYSADYKRLESYWYAHKEGGFQPKMRDSVPYEPSDPFIQAIIRSQIERDPRSRSFYGTDQTAIDREARRMCDIYNSSWSHHLNELDVDALIKANRLWDFTRTWSKADGWVDKDPAYTPTPREVNDWSLQGFGHDSSNCWIVIGAELERLKLPKLCSYCDGEGDIWKSKEDKEAYEAWESFGPPVGDGFQLWETTSEGSPKSPVFDTMDVLCSWCAENATVFGGSKATAQEWRGMLDEDFVYHKEGNCIFI